MPAAFDVIDDDQKFKAYAEDFFKIMAEYNKWRFPLMYDQEPEEYDLFWQERGTSYSNIMQGLEEQAESGKVSKELYKEKLGEFQSGYIHILLQTSLLPL